MTTKKETLEERNARTRRQNEAFERLSAPKKRVSIAHDVLAQIDLNRIRVETGTYFESEVFKKQLFEIMNGEASSSKQLQTVFRKVETCTACALGSMFLCGVETANKLKIRETNLVRMSLLMSEDVYTYLSRFFSMEQLVVIESAFEHRNMLREHRRMSKKFNYLSGKALQSLELEVTDAVTFGNLESNDTIRLQLIMRNIIANRGTFNPKDRPFNGWVTPNYNS